MKRIQFIALMLILAGNELSSQDWRTMQFPRLSQVSTNCEVIADNKSKIYNYYYNFFSDYKNIGNIFAIKIDISRSPNSVSYDTIGLIYESKYTLQSFRRHYPGLEHSIVPVGFPKVPYPELRWTADISPQKMAEFVFSSDSIRLTPGTNINNIVIMSKALPGIRKYSAEPPPLDLRDYFLSPEGEATASRRQMDSVENSLIYDGWTVGPIAPPIAFSAFEWCDTLTSFTHRSVELNWLTSIRDHDCDGDERPDGGVAGNLEKYIMKIRSRLSNGDTMKAVHDLNKFIKKVERIHKRSEQAIEKGRTKDAAITSEAYALLKYNAEYIISRLIASPPRQSGTLLQH